MEKETRSIYAKSMRYRIDSKAPVGLSIIYSIHTQFLECVVLMKNESICY